jgi:excisionase family DNA binding protein
MQLHPEQQPILLIGVKQIAAALGIGSVRVRRMLKAGQIPAYMLDGKYWVSTRTVLESWAAAEVARWTPRGKPVNS